VSTSAATSFAIPGIVSVALDANGLAGFNDAFVMGLCDGFNGIEQEQGALVANIEGRLLFVRC
jgi:hypothetical protein